MSYRQDLLNLIKLEVKHFNQLNFNNNIVPNSIPIVWFGDVEKYFKSSLKIITVSLNPSDNEFIIKKQETYSTKYRFPAYIGTVDSLYTSYNEYFTKQPYGIWFKASFSTVLESFNASHYTDNGAANTALHTDLGSSYATKPTWSRLSSLVQSRLEPLASTSWHNLIKILKPDVILISASDHFENKLQFPQIGKWTKIDVKTDRPLLSGKFQIVSSKQTSVLFQVQGRKPFLKTSKEEKIKFHNYI